MLMNRNNFCKAIGKSVSDGIFDVNYLRPIDFEYIDNNQGVFMDLTHGHFIEISPNCDPANDNNFESCAEHK